MRKNLKLKLSLLTYLYTSSLFAMEEPDPISPSFISKSNSSNKLDERSQGKTTIKKLLKFHLESKDRDFEGIIETTEELDKTILEIKHSRLNQHIFFLRMNSNMADFEGEKSNYLAGIQISKSPEGYTLDYFDPTGNAMPQEIRSLFQKNFNIYNINSEINSNNKMPFLEQNRDDQALFLTHLFKHWKKTKFLKKTKFFLEIQNLPKFIGCLRKIYQLELQIPDLSYKPGPNDIKNLALKFGTLGHLYLEVGDAIQDVSYYNEAALFYNYFISMAKDSDSLIKDINPYGMLNSIQNKLVGSIGGYQEELKQIVAPEDCINISRQNDLIELRTYVNNKIEDIEKREDSIEASKQLFQYITTRMKNYLATLYKDAEKVLGAPPCPCDYTIIGLGSMALQQMTPYSDLEFAILISDQKDEDSSQKVKNYFKDLTQLVHFWVINLGESIIPPEKYSCDLRHLVRKAVNFDLGGKTPLGREDKPYELICTVDTMFKYMCNEDEKSEHIDTTLPYILQKVCFVDGSEYLFDQYNRKVAGFLKGHGEARAVKILWEGCCERDYTSYSERESKMLANIKQFSLDTQLNGKKLNVKQDIYRLPDRFIYNFGLIYGIDAEDNWETITKLAEDEKINRDAEKNLKKALTFASLLRLKVYSYYDQHNEEIDWDEECSDHDQAQEGGLIGQTMVKTFQLNSEDLQENGAFFEYYYATLPLTWKLGEFCVLQKNLFLKKNVFFKKTLFYNNCASVKAEINLRLGRIGSALKYQKLELPSLKEYIGEFGASFIGKRHYKIAGMYYESGDFINAIYHCNTALEMEPSNEHLCDIYNRLGNSWRALGNYQESDKNFRISLEIQTKNTSVSANNATELLIETYDGLGVNLWHQSNFKESLEYLWQSLQLAEQKLDKNHPLTAQCYNNYGTILQASHKKQDALSYFKKSLKIRKKIYSKNYYSIAAEYYNIGEMYKDDNLISKALKSFEKARKISEKALGVEHPANAPIYEQMAVVYSNLKNHHKASDYCFKSLKCREKLGNDHPDIGRSYLTAAYILNNSMEYSQALGYCKKALMVMQDKLDKSHPSIMSAYHIMGSICINQKNYKESEFYFRKELESIEHGWGRCHPKAAETYLSISRTLFFQEKYKEALRECTKALKINSKENNLVGIRNSYELMTPIFMKLGYKSKVKALYKANDDEDYFYLHKWKETGDITTDIIVTIAPKLDWISQHVQDGYESIKNMIGGICKNYKYENDKKIVEMLCFEAICLGLADGRLKWEKSLDCLLRFCWENIDLVKKIAKVHPEYFVKKEIIHQCMKVFPKELKELEILLQDPK